MTFKTKPNIFIQLVFFPLSALLITICAISAPAQAQTPIYTSTPTASGTQDPTPTLTPTPMPISRSQAQILQKTTHQWALFWWTDNTLACSIFLNSEDQPSQEQVRLACGHEPVEGYAITAVYVRVGQKSYECDSAVCVLEMPLTGDQGVQVEYWAVSSEVRD